MRDWKVMLREKNVGIVDQRIRLFLGIALAFLYLAGIGGVFGLIASAVLIVTGARRSCPVYAAMGYTSARPELEIRPINKDLNQ